ncbi:hypothetical protein AWF91_02630 [Escherichia coli]|nr:hypothetical protein AWE76_23800 [Escherichia coli]KUU21896.1 hypothetical protein AWF18_16835 [Escherichia coli]KUV86919.1 hypothetical protein AWF51_13940 [Escherichia coli]KUW35844.1 hypothetical protein AWF60_05965 [Escherichia coli]KUX68631.1 hypothetical protein AWF91_02630 [Escherichia coli]
MNISEVDLHKLTVSDPFLGQYQQLVRDVVIPYQWDALNDRIPEAEPSHAIENFRIAAGLQDGEFYGMVFQDSDVAKWLEAVAWSLCQKPDAELEKTADEVIELVASAQCEDGYLNTYFTVKAPEERWSNLAECHELYCAGHLIEAGVAFFQATGKRRLLEVVCRLADHIDSVFGPGESKLHGYPGHPEIELALMRLAVGFIFHHPRRAVGVPVRGLPALFIFLVVIVRLRTTLFDKIVRQRQVARLFGHFIQAH